MSEKWNNMVQQLTADKKKLSLLVCMLALGLLLWGRFLLNKVPRTAVAEPSVVAAAAVLPAPSEADASLAPRRAVQVDLYRTLDRNVFDLDTRGYALAPRPESETQVTEKSGPKPVDENEHARVIREAARALTLQTTMLGDRPRAVINGQVLYPGDKFRGFVLSSVHARHVILERDGVQVQLEM
ncbi:MAG: general secretion pathway protein GspB [Planctomycetes bacterium]|nr:general secretion pathway protein GspB [Planctomycetota bacterium]